MKRTMLIFALLMVARCLTAADFVIAIDAEKDEFYTHLSGPADGWIHIPFQASNDNPDGSHGKHDNEFDLSANFWCAWDDTYFYFYEEVSDEYVTCSSETNYLNDCLEIKFDPDPLIGEPAAGTGVYAMRLTALDSSETDGPLPGVDNMYPEGNDSILGFRYIAGEDYARKENNSGYVVEGRLPWQHVFSTSAERGPVLAGVGNVFGMAIMNHDRDDDTFEGSIEWASELQDAVWNNVNFHGTMTFLEGNTLSMSTMNTVTGTDTNSIDYTPKNVGVARKLLAPIGYSLAQNYPNPFNPTTTIEFTLPVQAQVMMKVYDLLGHEIAVLVDEFKTAGAHSALFDGAEFAGGVYLVQINNGQEILTKKMMLIK